MMKSMSLAVYRRTTPEGLTAKREGVEWVAVAFTPGLGDAESERGGLVEEGGFGDLSSTLETTLRIASRRCNYGTGVGSTPRIVV
jgi:hypothetical protein